MAAQKITWADKNTGDSFSATEATQVKTVTNSNADLVDGINTKVQNVLSSATTSIPFSSLFTVLPQLSISAPVTFTVNSTGSIVGGIALLRIVADGTNIPDFSAFTQSSLGGYINRNGVVNLITFMYDGTTYRYFVTNAANDVITQIATPTLSAASVSATEIDVTIGTVSGATIYQIERSANGTSGWAIIYSSASPGTFADTGRTTGTTYYYRGKVFGNNTTTSDSSYATASATAAGTSLTPLTWTGKTNGVAENSNGGLAYSTGGNNGFGNVGRSTQAVTAGQKVQFRNGDGSYSGNKQKMIGITQAGTFTGYNAQSNNGLLLGVYFYGGGVNIISNSSYVSGQDVAGVAVTDLLRINVTSGNMIVEKSTNNGSSWTTIFTPNPAIPKPATAYVACDFNGNGNDETLDINEINIA